MSKVLLVAFFLTLCVTTAVGQRPDRNSVVVPPDTAPGVDESCEAIKQFVNSLPDGKIAVVGQSSGLIAAFCPQWPTLKQVVGQCSDVPKQIIEAANIACASKRTRARGSGTEDKPSRTDIGSKKPSDLTLEDAKVATCQDIKAQIAQIMPGQDSSPTDIAGLVQKFCPFWAVLAPKARTCSEDEVPTSIQLIASGACSQVIDQGDQQTQDQGKQRAEDQGKQQGIDKDKLETFEIKDADSKLYCPLIETAKGCAGVPKRIRTTMSSLCTSASQTDANPVSTGNLGLAGGRRKVQAVGSGTGNTGKLSSSSTKCQEIKTKLASVIANDQIPAGASPESLIAAFCPQWPALKISVEQCSDLNEQVVKAADAACAQAKGKGSGIESSNTKIDSKKPLDNNIDAAKATCQEIKTKFTDFVLEENLVPVSLSCTDLPTGTDKLDTNTCKSKKAQTLMATCASKKVALTKALVKKCAELQGAKTKTIKKKFLKAKKKYAGCLSDAQKEGIERVTLDVFNAQTGTFTYETTCQSRKMRRLNDGSTSVDAELFFEDDNQFAEAQQKDANTIDAEINQGLNADEDTKDVQASGSSTITAEEQEILVVDDTVTAEQNNDDSKGAEPNDPLSSGSSNHFFLFSNIVFAAVALFQLA